LDTAQGFEGVLRFWWGLLWILAHSTV